MTKRSGGLKSSSRNSGADPAVEYEVIKHIHSVGQQGARPKAVVMELEFKQFLGEHVSRRHDCIHVWCRAARLERGFSGIVKLRVHAAGPFHVCPVIIVLYALCRLGTHTLEVIHHSRQG